MENKDKIEGKISALEKVVKVLKKIKLCYITTLIYVFFIGFKLVKEQFIVPQDYVFIGLLTLIVLISYIYDLIRYKMKLKSKRLETKEVVEDKTKKE